MDAVSDPGTVRYVGLITRAIAFLLDAIVISVIALVAEFGVALIVTVLHLPSEVRKWILAVGAGVYVLWTIGYFVGFWSTTGQTPGNRLMRLRILTAGGEVMKPRRALLRCGALVVAALPLLAGFLLIPFSSRRRGLQDVLARTIAVEAPDLSFAERRRAQRRASAAGRSPDSGDDRNGARADARLQRERVTPDSVGVPGQPKQRL